MPFVESFEPWVGRDPVVLILGSMPGVASLQQQRYYAHPRNAFWPILGEIFGIDWADDYARRRAQFESLPLALWDVLQGCEREGSLDAAIDPRSLRINRLPELLNDLTGIERILFNGATAERLFKRHVLPMLADATPQLLRLPSTSPAHAGIGFDEKLARWREALAPVISAVGASNISKS